MTRDRPFSIAPESLLIANGEPSPARLLRSSRDIGWSSLLVDHIEARGRADAYDKPVTEDFSLVVGISGAWDASIMRGGRWRGATFQAGSIAFARSGEPVRLQWQNRHHSQPWRLAKVFIPKGVLAEAAEHYRRAGRRYSLEPDTPLVLNDRTISGTVTGLLRALENDDDDLYAEVAARWLATHLISVHGRPYQPNEDDRDIGSLDDRRLARVVEYMRANIGQRTSIADMARVAAVSPFHFSRLFQHALGVSPQRYLTERRLSAARQLLATTDLPIAEIATACGFTRATSFTAAYSRRYGQSPSGFRRAR